MNRPKIGILDCGSGNLRSVYKAFRREGALPVISKAVDPEWDGLVLPGVGAFGHAMRNIDHVRDDIFSFVRGGRHFLGICLGLQVLMESSEENPGAAGLGLVPGSVVRIEAEKVPHIGWNSLDIKKESQILAGIETGTYFYFVHSYHADPADEVVVASCSYQGSNLTAAVETGNVHACQFHPEKSGSEGLKIIGNFSRLAGDG